ncbi:MAG: alpha/beta fold hydrolase [Candidatus Aquicultorales bacterium]
MAFIKVERNAYSFVQDWGSGRPVFFLHGWPFSHRIFEYQMMKLAERGYRAVGMDIVGFGLSEKPWHGLDFDTWAKDVGKVLRSLNLRDVILAGFSMGGAICTRYLAMSNDRRVTKLALMGAAVPSIARGPEGTEPANKVIAGVQADQPKFVHDFIKDAFNTQISAEYQSWLDQIGVSASLRACVRGFEELRDRDLGSDLSAIEIPALVLHGRKDRVVPFSLGQEQERLLRNSTLVPFENSGHALFWDEKDKLASELEGFAAAAGKMAA